MKICRDSSDPIEPPAPVIKMVFPLTNDSIDDVLNNCNVNRFNKGNRMFEILLKSYLSPKKLITEHKINKIGFDYIINTLESIDNVSMYKLKMQNEDDVELYGMALDVSETVFDLAEGYNWIGYSPQVSYDINTALFNIPDGNAEYIKR